MAANVAQNYQRNQRNQVEIAKHLLSKRDFGGLLPDGISIDNITGDELRHAVYRSIELAKDNDGSPKFEFSIDEELNFIEGAMFIAYLTAYCLGKGFPDAGLTEGLRDFVGAKAVCQGGLNEESGKRRSVMRNNVIERASTSSQVMHGMLLFRQMSVSTVVVMMDEAWSQPKWIALPSRDRWSTC